MNNKELQITPLRINATKGQTSKKLKKFIYKNGSTTVSMDDMVAPSYAEIKSEINKKIGEQMKMPEGLTKGEWTQQAMKVLGERYLVKDKDLKIIWIKRGWVYNRRLTK
jgi:hypothetical protein